jgi:hypothetical protein
MPKAVAQILRVLLITCTGLLGSIVAGLIMHGGAVFNTRDVAFSFVSYGLSGSFIFAFYHVRGLSETITAAVIVSALQFGISTTLLPVVNAAILSFGVNLPIILVAFIFERKLAPFRRFRFVVVSILYGAMFVLLTLLTAPLTGVEILPAQAFRENFVDGLLIGLGLGLGIEAGEAFIHSLEHHSVGQSGPTEKHA